LIAVCLSHFLFEVLEIFQVEVMESRGFSSLVFPLFVPLSMLWVVAGLFASRAFFESPGDSGVQLLHLQLECVAFTLCRNEFLECGDMSGLFVKRGGRGAS
jgi:hypothetical protein